jgi:hypothetical protein
VNACKLLVFVGAMTLCATASLAGNATTTFRDDADGFQVTVPADWTKGPIPDGFAYIRVVFQSPSYDSTYESCNVVAKYVPDQIKGPQDQLNALMTSGTMMKVWKARAPQSGMEVQGGNIVQLPGGVVALASEGTLGLNHLFGLYKTTGHFKDLLAMIPANSYAVTCAVEQSDYPAHHKELEQIIATFKIIARK